MNHLQPNEKQLADKLQHVPVPDVDQSWEKMQELLDRDKPRAVAGWASNSKWWWTGIAAASIMLAVWLTQELNQSKNERAPESENATAAKGAGKQDEPGNVNTGKNAKENNNLNSTGTSSTNKNNNINNDNNSTASTAIPLDNISATPAADNVKTKPEDQQKVAGKISNKPTNQPAQQKNIDKRAQHVITPVLTDKYVNNKQDKDLQTTDVPFQSSRSITTTGNEAGLKLANVSNELAYDRPQAAPGDAFTGMDEVKPDKDLLAKADKAEVRKLRQKYMEKDNRRMSGGRMRGNYGGNEHEITFAAGLTLPQSFAVGGQQASSYNITGKTGRLTDYIPAPFFQYHLNNKIFLQTEFHFQSPQYTQKLLLNQHVIGDSSGQTYREINSSYLEKLYYFNIPLNVYYTPAPNFYIGTGVQYSSFLGGVLLQERRVTQQGITDVQNSAYRFRDDSLAMRISPSEFRYQFDANYYFQRFTLGLRYNQAMKDFVKVNDGRVRNKSLLLYLRFNIWEERKKGANY